VATAGTVSREDLTKFYSPLDGYLKKAASDLWWWFDGSIERLGGDDIKRIYGTCHRSERVKPEASVFRKCQRDEIATAEEILDDIEDLIGLRIVASNKKDAQSIYEFLQGNRDHWFCETTEPPKFTPYTLAERNGYSIKTGYQAFHITFVFSRSYLPGTEVSRWPVEMQITSQLWEYYANYSRKYFYTAKGEMVDKLRPYTVAIARALDAAEDIVVTTTNILEGKPAEDAQDEGSEG